MVFQLYLYPGGIVVPRVLDQSDYKGLSNNDRQDIKKMLQDEIDKQQIRLMQQYGNPTSAYLPFNQFIISTQNILSKITQSEHKDYTYDLTKLIASVDNQQNKLVAYITINEKLYETKKYFSPEIINILNVQLYWINTIIGTLSPIIIFSKEFRENGEKAINILENAVKKLMQVDVIIYY